MVWTISFSETATKQLKKLGKQPSMRILDYLIKRISISLDPRQYGKVLSYNKAGLWRYRVGDYRIICKIYDETITILVLEIGHRKEIYE